MKQKFKATPPLMLLMKDVRLLEHDAHSQYRFNRFWAIIWGMSMAGVLVSLWPHTKTQAVQLAILEVSLWANFATHFGAMSAALAAMNTSQTVKDAAGGIADISEDVDDIHEAIADQV